MLYTRRDFLKSTTGMAGVLTLAPSVPSLFLEAGAHTPSDQGGRVLVVLQLSGGNDGLNTVVPYADDHYARSRPTLRMLPGDVHKMNDTLGFHTRMQGCYRLFQEGRLSVLQGVGLPKGQGDHDYDMRIWHTGDPDAPDRQTGWIGRTADRCWQADQTNPLALFIGSITRPYALNARDCFIPFIQKAKDLTTHDTKPESPSKTTNPLQAFIEGTSQQAQAQAARLKTMIDSAPRGTVSYPPSGLGRDLRTVAQCLRADLGTRIYFVELGGGGIGGFDNHANQKGNHCALLYQLSEALAAFVDDLQRDKLLDRVLLITFSEFGRTLAENGRRGTGHGNAAPLFLAGGGLQGGLVGSHPDLSDLEGVALKYHTDFRQVYATVLSSWLEIDAKPILGADFPVLDVFA